MARIETVPISKAEGLLQDLYESAKKRAGRVFQILQLMSPNPAALRDSVSLYRSLMFGESPLSRAQREFLAVVVSRKNHCHY